MLRLKSDCFVLLDVLGIYAEFKHGLTNFTRVGIGDSVAGFESAKDKKKVVFAKASSHLRDKFYKSGNR